jgi:hypothetical protein
MVSNKDVVGRATRVVIKGDLLALAGNLYAQANFKIGQAISANFPISMVIFARLRLIIANQKRITVFQSGPRHNNLFVTPTHDVSVSPMLKPTDAHNRVYLRLKRSAKSVHFPQHGKNAGYPC